MSSLQKQGRRSQEAVGFSPPFFANFLKNLPFLPQSLAILCLQPPHFLVSTHTFKFTPLSLKNGVEDEIHFIMKCTQFEELHAKMLQLVENKCVAFKSLYCEQKLFIFSQTRTEKSVVAYQNLL